MLLKVVHIDGAQGFDLIVLDFGICRELCHCLFKAEKLSHWNWMAALRSASEVLLHGQLADDVDILFTVPLIVKEAT